MKAFKIIVFYLLFWLAIAAVLLGIGYVAGWGTESTYDSYPEPY